MDSELTSIFKPFKFVFILLLFELFFLFTFFTNLFSSYDKNLFEVKLNNQLMNCYYSEKFNNAFFIRAGTSGYNQVLPRVNNVELNNQITLQVYEYEVYSKNGRRVSSPNGWVREQKLSYQQIFTKNIKIKIKRMGEILYEGEYITDLSKYMNESGRYYIHIYSVRKEGLFASVKTHISFNVIVGGGNHNQ